MLVQVTQEFVDDFDIDVPVGFKVKAADIKRYKLVFVPVDQIKLIGVWWHTYQVDSQGLVAVHTSLLEPC